MADEKKMDWANSEAWREFPGSTLADSVQGRIVNYIKIEGTMGKLTAVEVELTDKFKGKQWMEYSINYYNRRGEKEVSVLTKHSGIYARLLREMLKVMGVIQ